MGLVCWFRSANQAPKKNFSSLAGTVGQQLNVCRAFSQSAPPCLLSASVCSKACRTQDRPPETGLTRNLLPPTMLPIVPSLCAAVRSPPPADLLRTSRLSRAPLPMTLRYWRGPVGRRHLRLGRRHNVPLINGPFRADDAGGLWHRPSTYTGFCFTHGLKCCMPAHPHFVSITDIS